MLSEQSNPDTFCDVVDNYFKTATSTPVKPPQQVYDSPTTPLNMSTNSWLSSSVLSHCGDLNESKYQAFSFFDNKSLL